jgi:hypothetical protein
MRRSEWLVRVVLVFCLVYGAIAIQDRGHEKFPFFAWDLFSTVPPQRNADYSVRILQAGGLRVALPVYFEQAKMYEPLKQGQGYIAIQVLGRTTARGPAGRAAVLRKRFELTYLNILTGVRYQLVRRVFDIRTRVKCIECFVSEKVIGTYTAG